MLLTPIVRAGEEVLEMATDGMASTVIPDNVPAVSASPEVRVAVIEAPVPADDKVTPETVVVFEPAVIVPVTVPPMVPAAPLVLKVNPVLATVLAASPPEV